MDDLTVLPAARHANDIEEHMKERKKWRMEGKGIEENHKTTIKYCFQKISNMVMKWRGKTDFSQDVLKSMQLEEGNLSNINICGFVSA